MCEGGCSHGARRRTPPYPGKIAERHLSPRTQRGGVLFAGKLLSALMTVVLAAGLLPIVPASPAVEEAEALEGTTNYADFFTIGHRDGRPGSISGNVLLGSDTRYTSGYGFRANRWASSSAFISKKPISLGHDWQVRIRANLADPTAANAPGNASKLITNVQIGLSSTSDPTSLKGFAGAIIKRWIRGTGKSSDIRFAPMSSSVLDGASVGPFDVAAADSYDIVLTYSSSANTVTLSGAGKTLVYYNVSGSVGSSPYLFVQPTIWWENGWYCQ